MIRERLNTKSGGKYNKNKIMGGKYYLGQIKRS